MPKTLFQVDLTKPMEKQELPGHNRWHPDIPAVVSVNPGDIFRIECKDWTDGQIKNNDSPDDIRDVDLSIVHVLSGPIWVNGAEPGDILVVDILDIGALQGDEWGFTGILPTKKNGGGFLTDHFPNPAKAIWDLEEIYTKSRHIPGVRFAGITHPGLIGCAPLPRTACHLEQARKRLSDGYPARSPYLWRGVHCRYPCPRHLAQSYQCSFFKPPGDQWLQKPLGHHEQQYLIFEGISLVDPRICRQTILRWTCISHYRRKVTAKSAFCGAIEYLRKFGFTARRTSLSITQLRALKAELVAIDRCPQCLLHARASPNGNSEYLIFRSEYSVPEYTGKQYLMLTSIAYRAPASMRSNIRFKNLPLYPSPHPQAPLSMYSAAPSGKAELVRDCRCPQCLGDASQSRR